MKTYTFTGTEVTRADSEDSQDLIEVRVPDGVSASDLDRALERLRRSIHKQERN